jgi:hypothetical protein
MRVKEWMQREPKWRHEAIAEAISAYQKNGLRCPAVVSPPVIEALIFTQTSPPNKDGGPWPPQGKRWFDNEGFIYVVLDILRFTYGCQVPSKDQ